MGKRAFILSKKFDRSVTEVRVLTEWSPLTALRAPQAQCPSSSQRPYATMASLTDCPLSVSRSPSERSRVSVLSPSEQRKSQCHHALSAESTRCSETAPPRRAPSLGAPGVSEGSFHRVLGAARRAARGRGRERPCRRWSLVGPWFGEHYNTASGRLHACVCDCGSHCGAEAPVQPPGEVPPLRAPLPSQQRQWQWALPRRRCPPSMHAPSAHARLSGC